jgi:excinuclease ABC subunit C
MPRVQKNRLRSPPAPEDPGVAAPPGDLDAGQDFAVGGAPASVRRGAATIRRFWEHAPAGPGVYRMIAANGEVLYVGKAKSVRKRIARYMRPRRMVVGERHRILRLAGPLCRARYGN